jgi:hypothetical protein
MSRWERRTIEEVFAIVLPGVVVGVYPRRNGLHEADTNERIVWVGIFQMQNLARLKGVSVAVKHAFVVR